MLFEESTMKTIRDITKVTTAMDSWGIVWYRHMFKILNISANCEHIPYVAISETVGDIAKRTTPVNS